MAASPMVIPTGERYGNLKPILFEFADTIAAIRSAHRPLAEQPTLFFFLMLPWLVDESKLPADQRQFMQRRKLEVRVLKFDAARAKQLLEEILANDKHLAECCPTPIFLANYLDSFFITPVADVKRAGTKQEQLEFAFQEFESHTYHQGRFRRFALSHLFNFNMDGNSAIFEGDSKTAEYIRIERIDANTIPGILGESGVQAFLHPLDAGNCFVIEEEGASVIGDMEWLKAKREKAYFFAEVLQYFKDGVVHLGYTVPFFLPNWAHQIRRQGLFFLGNPRLMAYHGGTKPFFLNGAERESLKRWWKAATTPIIAEAIKSKKGKLRQATYRAAQYYEAANEREEPTERLVALAIGFESLFSPGDQGELSFRISQSAAQLIGKNAAERSAIFDDLRKMYSRRSKLLHGTYDLEKYDKGEFVTHDEIDRWSGYLRRAYLGFLAVYLAAYLAGQKEEERDPLLRTIAEAHFNEATGVKLRQDADIEALLAQFVT